MAKDGSTARRLITGALLAALVLLLLSGADSPAGAAKKKAAPKPVPERALKALRALEALEPRALRLFPDSFGGLWLDNGKVFVAFTGRARQRVDRLEKTFPGSKALRAVPVDDSFNALDALQARMISDRSVDPVTITDPLSARPRRLPLTYALEIDVKRNAVVAHPHQAVTAEMTAAFAARYGSDVLVEYEPPPGPHGLIVCTGRTYCPPTLRAGLETHAESGTNCTTAFNVTYNSVNGPTDGLLSAAHCGNPDADYLDDRSHAGSVYGSVVAEQQSGQVDGELHSSLGLFEGVAPWNAQAPWIYISDATKRAPVTKAGTYAGLTVGATVCRAGITTAPTCGEVLNKTYSFDGYVDNAYDFIKTDYCSGPGDSGGPVYSSSFPFFKMKIAQKADVITLFSSRRAQGVHSGGALDTPCNASNYYALFSHIEFVAGALSATVTTTGN